MDQNLPINLQKWPFWAAEEDPEPWGQLGRLTEAKNVKALHVQLEPLVNDHLL